MNLSNSHIMATTVQYHPDLTKILENNRYLFKLQDNILYVDANSPKNSASAEAFMYALISKWKISKPHYILTLTSYEPIEGIEVFSPPKFRINKIKL